MVDSIAPKPGSIVDRAAGAYVGLALRGLRAATKITTAMLAQVTDDPRTDAIRAEIATTFRRLLDLPEAIAGGGSSAARLRPDDTAVVAARFQQLLDDSRDIRTVQGEAALVEIVAQLAPDEARMLKKLKELTTIPAADLLQLSVAGGTQDILLRGINRLAERAGAADVAREAIYTRNLRRLDLIEWQPITVPNTDDYQLFEGRMDVAEHARRLRDDRSSRTKLRKGRFVLTPLGERLLAIGDRA